MKKLTMRERRNLLCYYLSGVANYSISDWAVNHLLLALIQIAHQEHSLSDVVNTTAQDLSSSNFRRLTERRSFLQQSIS